MCSSVRTGSSWPLTYSPDTDWVKNGLAAGAVSCGPGDALRQGIRPLERQMLQGLRVADFLSLSVDPVTARLPAG